MLRIARISICAVLAFVPAVSIYGQVVENSQVVGQDYFQPAPHQPYPQGAVYQAAGPDSSHHVRFSAEMMVLDRQGTNSNDFLVDFVTGESLLTHDNLSGPAQLGVRFGITLFSDECNSTEFNYFQMDHFGSVQTVESVNLITFQFFGGFPANPESQYTVHYTSVIESFEVNRRRKLTDRIEGLIGFRYVDLNETFDISSDGGVFSSGIENNLYGLQLGGDLLLKRIGLSKLTATVKGGLFYDNADVRGSALNPANGQFMRFVNDADELAFLGEIRLGFWVPMGSSAALNIGYQGLYLDGVGLASHQLNSTSIFTGQGTVPTSSVWYHGGYVGFEFTW